MWPLPPKSGSSKKKTIKKNLGIRLQSNRNEQVACKRTASKSNWKRSTRIMSDITRPEPDMNSECSAREKLIRLKHAESKRWKQIVSERASRRARGIRSFESFVDQLGVCRQVERRTAEQTAADHLPMSHKQSKKWLLLARNDNILTFSWKRAGRTTSQ